MTEKRFERIYGDVDIFCKDHNAKGLSQLIEKEDYDTIVDLLNRLADENEQLRLQLNLCSDQRNEFHRGARENANRVGKLEKENEQLKDALNQRTEQCDKYYDENEQLKQLIKKVLETTPIEHSLAIELKNSVRELYD